MQIIDVKDYHIYIGMTLESLLRGYFQEKYADCLIITDNQVAPLYLATVKKALETKVKRMTEFIVPSGETSKNLATIESLYHFSLENGLDRHSLVVACGGGVITDISGFFAATYMRGVDFIQIPTTLLAQVDASIGGKTGVNLPEGKNLVGAFYQPQAVYIATECLNTLSKREFYSGMAEVIKYGLLFESEFCHWLQQQVQNIELREPHCLERLIAFCCRQKAKIVNADAQEQGCRALLNLGHTLGHALEKITQYKVYTHGEAVAIGMYFVATRLSPLTEAEKQVVYRLLQSYHLPYTIPRAVLLTELYNSMLHDKKVKDGQINWVILEKIGHAEWNRQFPEKIVLANLETMFDGNKKEQP